MNKKTKLAIQLGSIISAVIPMASLISCASTNNDNNDVVIDDGYIYDKNLSTGDNNARELIEYIEDIKENNDLNIEFFVNSFTHFGFKVEMNNGTSDKLMIIGNKYKDVDRFVKNYNVLTREMKKNITLDDFTQLFNDPLFPGIAEKIKTIFTSSKDLTFTAKEVGTELPDNGDDKTPKTVLELKEKFPNYYSTLNENLRGTQLYNALHEIQKKYREEIGSYSFLWTIYKTAYLDKFDEKDDTIYDIYSEIVGGKDQFSFIPGDNQNSGSYKNPGDSYNREHLIPQSIFGKTTRYIHDDAHFVYPTDSKINGLRSNYVHDNVESASKEGSSFGGNNWEFGIGSNGQTAFEPDDNFKGDIARSYFYFSLTWGDYRMEKEYDVFDGSFSKIKKIYQDVYLRWSDNDPIDDFDIYRNKHVSEFQGGLRNPFVDMPKLIDYIWR